MISTLKIKDDIGELEVINNWLQDLRTEYHLESKTVGRFELAIEEIVTNIIKYGYQKNGKNEIILSFDSKESLLSLIIEDTGPEFNPLLVPPPSPISDDEELSVGGLGIYLVKKMMDDVQYIRKDNKNILKITCKVEKQ